MSSYLALVFAISMFQAFLINRNWQYTSYMSCVFSSLLYLLWILVFYDEGGLRNGWFTVFIDLDRVSYASTFHLLYLWSRTQVLPTPAPPAYFLLL